MQNLSLRSRLMSSASPNAIMLGRDMFRAAPISDDVPTYRSTIGTVANTDNIA